MKSLKFSANITNLFSETPFIDRYQLAKKFNFSTVESSGDVVYEYPAEKIAQQMSKFNIRHDLINSWSVGIPEITDGFAALPGKEGEFLQSVNKAVGYSFHLKCQKIHILSGSIDSSFDENDQENALVENLLSITEMLEAHNLIGLIEPMCPEAKPNYFLNSFDKAVRVIEKIDHPHVKLLLDIYHLQMLKEKTASLTDEIKKYYPYVGHIQVSQNPGRREPSFPGDIDYKNVFKTLESLKHADFIGLEFTPSGTTEEALKALLEFGLNFH